MNEPILTRDRFIALSHIGRWRGWTRRPYSVGEHTAIGFHVMHWFKRPTEQMRRWWLHDIHETEIVGDVPTPDKKTYMNDAYEPAVQEFDFRLGAEAGCTDLLWWRDAAVATVDWKMLLVENDLIALRSDPDLPAPDYDDPFQSHIRQCIEDETFATPERVIRLWNKWAWMFGWNEV